MSKEKDRGGGASSCSYSGNSRSNRETEDITGSREYHHGPLSSYSCKTNVKTTLIS